MSDAPVSYVPGPWTALVRGDVTVLIESRPASALVAACWTAAEAGVDAVLAAVDAAGIEPEPGFAVAGTGSAGTRLVVGGRGRVEVSAPERPEPMVVAAEGPGRRAEQRLPGRPVLHLTAGPDTPFGEALPLAGGVVPASGIAVGVAAFESRDPEPPAAAAAPVVPDPIADRPVSGDTVPPRSDFDSGLIDSLPWRTPEAYTPPAEPVDTPAEPPSAPAEPQPIRPTWGEPPPVQPERPGPPAAPAAPPAAASPWGPPQSPPQSPPQAPPANPWAAPSPPPEWPPPPRPGQQPQQGWAPPGQRPEPTAALPAQNPWAPPESPAAPAAAPGSSSDEDALAAPAVMAFACPRRHLNPPYAGRCRICDDPIPPQEGFTVPRPSLGVLSISNGDSVPLDRDVVLGRAPFHPDENAASRPHLVQLASPGNDISRSHVRVGLENWFVQVTDLGSTNGTVVTLPNQAPVRLRPHDPFTILPGTTITIADEVTVRFEAAG